MSEKQKIIQQMLEMQKRFIEIEKAGEFDVEQYYDSESESELSQYKKTFEALARQLVDLAHEVKGSQR